MGRKGEGRPLTVDAVYRGMGPYPDFKKATRRAERALRAAHESGREVDMSLLDDTVGMQHPRYPGRTIASLLMEALDNEPDTRPRARQRRRVAVPAARVGSSRAASAASALERSTADAATEVFVHDGTRRRRRRDDGYESYEAVVADLQSGKRVSWKKIVYKQPEILRGFLRWFAENTDRRIPASMLEPNKLCQPHDFLNGHSAQRLYAMASEEVAKEGSDMPPMAFLLEKAGIRVTGADILSVARLGKPLQWGRFPGPTREFLNLVKEGEEAANPEQKLLPVSMWDRREFYAKYSVINNRTLSGLYGYYRTIAKRTGVSPIEAMHTALDMRPTVDDVLETFSLKKREIQLDKLSWRLWLGILTRVASELEISVTQITTRMLRDTLFSSVGGHNLRKLAEFAWRNRAPDEAPMRFLFRKAMRPPHERRRARNQTPGESNGSHPGVQSDVYMARDVKHGTNLQSSMSGIVKWSKMDPSERETLILIEADEFVAGGGKLTAKHLQKEGNSDLAAAITRYFPDSFKGVRAIVDVSHTVAEKINWRGMTERDRIALIDARIEGILAGKKNDERDITGHDLQREGLWDPVVAYYPGGYARARVNHKLKKRPETHAMGYWTTDKVTQGLQAIHQRHGYISGPLLIELGETALLIAARIYGVGLREAERKAGIKPIRPKARKWNIGRIEQTALALYRRHGELTRDLLSTIPGLLSAIQRNKIPIIELRDKVIEIASQEPEHRYIMSASGRSIGNGTILLPTNDASSVKISEAAEVNVYNEEDLVPVVPPEWTTAAKCVTDRDRFDEAKAHGTVFEQRKVKVFCRGCHTRGLCLAEALEGREKGMWGGMTETERDGLIEQVGEENVEGLVVRLRRENVQYLQERDLI